MDEIAARSANQDATHGRQRAQLKARRGCKEVYGVLNVAREAAFKSLAQVCDNQSADRRAMSKELDRVNSMT